MYTVKNIAGVVLAGGKNSRYNGFDKSFLKKGNSTFIEHTISTFRELFHEIIIITNQPETYNFIEAIKSQDLIKDIGPLGGIYTALKVTTQPAIFVVSCDMPYLDHTMIKQLTKEFDTTTHDILMPCVEGDIEPLHAIYSTSIISAIEKNIKEKKFAIRDVFPLVRIKYVDLPSTPSNKKYFTNVNSPADFEQLSLELSIVNRGFLNL
jgi:molybdopterin-guanine dinucleotide biosynthesis protein A